MFKLLRSACVRGFSASLLLVLSPKSFALGEQVLALSVEQVDLVLYGLGGLIALLLIIILLQKFGSWRNRKKISQQALQLSQQLAFFDSFTEGCVQLNQQGEIVFVNRSGCYFLGKKSEDILHKPFSGFFATDIAQLIEQKLNDKQASKLQIFARNRHLLLSFTTSNDFPADIAAVITLADITNFQIKLDKQASDIKHLEVVFDNTQLGQFSLNLDKKTFSSNALFANMLGLQTPPTGELKTLQNLVDKADLFEFNQALERLKKESSIEVNSHFTTEQGKLLVRLFGLVTQYNDKGEALALHFVVQNQSALAKGLQQAQVSEQLAKALLTSSRHALYILDNSAQVVSCNSAFENLFKTSLSKIKSQDISNFDFFPDNIKQLHHSSQGDFSVSRFGQDKEFELTSFDKVVRNIRLSLKYYGDEQGNRAGMVGMLEDISEIKQTKLLVERERKRLADFMHLAPLAIATFDGNDNILQANQAMTKRLGSSEKELKKTTFYQLFNDPNHSAKAAKNLHQHGHLHGFKALLQGQHGLVLPSELNIDLWDKEQQQYLCWIADISAEQWQRDRFETLLQHSNEPMAVLTEKGFSSLNTAACDFFMLEDQQELLGFTPYAPGLNKDQEAVAELEKIIGNIKVDGKIQSLLWEHQVNAQILPCQITFLPLANGQDGDTILCVWKDFRAIKEAERARLEAINLQQAAQRQVEEKQKLLESSQDLLANKVKSLADTQTQLQAAQEDLSEKQSEISDLQQAHQDVSDNLQRLQHDYKHSREKLLESENLNAELGEQLESSVAKVRGLQEQRNQIADALQYSERKHAAVQTKLVQSEKLTQNLQKEQQNQQQKMSDFVTQIESLKQSIEDKDQQIVDVSTQINALQSQLSSSGRTTEKLRELLINQRKASEEAEEQRRQLEFTCHTAQSELSSKARHIEHLQHEMHKFEEMSDQQKGDMQQQQAQLMKELEAKQLLLNETQQTLDETQKASAQEKAEKEQQQQVLQKLQEELAQMEQVSLQHQQQSNQASQSWQQQQEQLQAELIEKQQKLLQTEQVLNEAKQQTEAEKAEKARQQEIFSQLQAELSALKDKEAEQQQQISQSDQQWREQQTALKQEAEAKQQQLQETQRQLDEKQRLADKEKRERIEQQHKLEQLTIELADVEKRASKQREMMEGSDEQRRQFLADIEQQKTQLQNALLEAEKQNAEMKSKLQGNLVELQKAESQVSQTQSGEQKLLDELNQARRQAEELQQRIEQQEQQEKALHQQLAQQQQTLQGREQNINDLQSKQAALTEELQAVQQEYQSSKQNLDAQDTNQSELAKQLAALEAELNNSKDQLESKEAALQHAQKQVESSQAKLTEQEKALVAAHKEELQQAQTEDLKNDSRVIPPFANLPLPANAEAWFDLLPYLQKQSNPGPLPVALNALMDELEKIVTVTDEGMEEEDLTKIKSSVRQMLALANRVNSVALIDQVTRLDAHCSQGLIDNISIAWPSVKKSLLTSLRVIYSHLHA
ncbi:PAS domain S-box protein [Paraglaciecola hydrolytica]|uniref:PAS domain S-box protein n=1 Tax=Paraglaciecola hydrolytica TaxID=1799789 RepID=UPI000838A5BF|nr:PAS domain S-box protein [Paraglaciecola hydrolytica]